jgi:hypothetical protein
MLVLISSLKLSTVPYAAGPESRDHSRTAWLNIDVKLLPKFHRWILNFVDQHTHENWYPTNKSDFTVFKISYNFTKIEQKVIYGQTVISTKNV